MASNNKITNFGLQLVTITSIDATDGITGEFEPEKSKICSLPTKLTVTFDEAEVVNVGDKVLAKLSAQNQQNESDGKFDGKIIRKLGSSPKIIRGVYKLRASSPILIPINKKDKRKYRIVENTPNAKEGDFVEVEILERKNRLLVNNVRVTKKFYRLDKTNVSSMFSVAEHEIPNVFPKAVTLAAKEIASQKIDNPTDLTHIPFISIDPCDARDHDDAMYAEVDSNVPGQYNIWVAIADVAKYVLPETSIDSEAYLRGNSTYFPDLVIPMLPDILSSQICSLMKNKNRASIVVKIVIDLHGTKISHQFFRAVIKNRLTMTYEDAQNSLDNPNFNRSTKNDKFPWQMQALYQVYLLLKKQKAIRQPLELEIEEQTMSFDQNGNIHSINLEEKLETHKIVEEIMILANICASETIEASNLPLLYRVHEPPTHEKILNLKILSKSLGFSIDTTKELNSKFLNAFLKAGERKGLTEFVSTTILRAMSQAHYSSKKNGHFGLNLKSYTHFTSPIRRYSDLLVHRALIAIHGWDNYSCKLPHEVDLQRIGEHLSKMERRSMIAERETKERFLASFLKKHIGSTFAGIISGISRGGIFVRLCNTGGEGLIPLSYLSSERFTFNKKSDKLIGKISKLQIEIGKKVVVKLKEANQISGGLIFCLVEYEGSFIDFKHKRKKRGRRK